MTRIELGHGSGGRLTHKLIADVFRSAFENHYLSQGNDAAVMPSGAGRIAMTTDSYVVRPLFFEGGNIGKMAVAGTVNDLVTAGAVPQYLTSSFIIEEGFAVEDLCRIVDAMAEAAVEAGVLIVTGDTKVVEKGACDGVYINTAGIGWIPEERHVSGASAAVGDAVILTGTMADHGCAILTAREGLMADPAPASDCAPLSGLLSGVWRVTQNIHVLRDPTRGGVAATLNEIALQSGVSIMLEETCLPVAQNVAGLCELLGLDPLYMANEGKMLIILPDSEAECVIEVLKAHPLGRNAAKIGNVICDGTNRVLLRTLAGGKRIVDMPLTDPLPRIC